MPSEPAITAVLLALWRAAPGAIAMPQLTRECALPPTDVHAALDALAARGCQIDRTPAGVSLRRTALSCWRDILEFEAVSHRRTLGRRVMVFSSVPSTNDIALQHAGDAQFHGLVVLADEQSAGRGRLGRSWAARPGQSILLSLLLHDMPADAMNRLTLLAGLAVAEAIEEVLAATGQPGRQVGIKWPNDLLLDGRKLAGILVERPPNDAGAVVGIGVNVAQSPEDFPPDLRQRANSLHAAGAPADRLTVIAALLQALDRRLAQGFSDDAWLNEWKRRCHLLGTHVTIQSSGNTFSGYVLDVSPLQGLVLKDDSGAIHFCSAPLSSLQ